MTERRTRRRSFEVKLDYTFDRLHALKLEQAYELLVPTRQRAVRAGIPEDTDEVGCDVFEEKGGEGDAREVFRAGSRLGRAWASREHLAQRYPKLWQRFGAESLG
jgi:hypothetical protein